MQSADSPAALTEADSSQPLCYRTVWISDLHLGTPGCQAVALLDFLKRVECDTLYLVGDIIDGWQLRRSWYWPQSHNDVVQKILRKARKGTQVVFVPGNHDEFARRYVEHNFGGVDVLTEAVHVTADGRKLWVTHGDLFDGVIQCAKWLAYLGDSAYEFTLRLNSQFNRLRARLGLPYWSLSKYLKLKVKRAVSYVSDFELAVAREARKRGLTAWCAATSTMPRSARLTACCIATMATGWRASLRWSSMPMAGWRLSTGRRAVPPCPAWWWPVRVPMAKAAPRPSGRAPTRSLRGAERCAARSCGPMFSACRARVCGIDAQVP